MIFINIIAFPWARFMRYLSYQLLSIRFSLWFKIEVFQEGVMWCHGAVSEQ